MGNFIFTDSLTEALNQTFPYSELISQTERYITSRLGPYIKQTQTFIAEKQYIDKAWRDLFSLHYCYTYHNQIHSYATTRIHMFSSKVDGLEAVTSESYLGYFTVRPIPAKHIISKFVLRPRSDCLGADASDELYVMACDIEVNIGHKRLSLKTFPMYAQDSVAAVCAHADMLMMAEFMHRKYGMNKPSLKAFMLKMPAFEGRFIPSRGLSIYQMAACLTQNGYELGLRYFSHRDSDADRVLNTIDSYIESSIPCVLAFDGHVVLVVGHTRNTAYDGHINKAGYIVIDDSGYHLHSSFGMGVAHIFYKVDYHSFRHCLSEALKKDGGLYCMAIEPDKLFLTFDDSLAIINHIEKQLGFPKCKKRFLVADSKKVKDFISNNNELPTLNDSSLPPYLWYVEFYNNAIGKEEDLMGVLLLDASAHKDDRYFSVLSKALLPVKYRLSLLDCCLGN